MNHSGLYWHHCKPTQFSKVIFHDPPLRMQNTFPYGTPLLSLFLSPRICPLYSPVSELLPDFPRSCLWIHCLQGCITAKGLLPLWIVGQCTAYVYGGITALVFKSTLWFNFHTHSLGLLYYIVFSPQATNLDLLRALHIPQRWRSCSWAGMNPSRGTDTFFGSQMPGSEKRSRFISWY